MRSERVDGSVVDCGARPQHTWRGAQPLVRVEPGGAGERLAVASRKPGGRVLALWEKDGGGNNGPSYGSNATLVEPGDVGVGTP